MSAKSTSSKSKSAAKSAAKPKSKAAVKPKSRLAGPKPPKARSSTSVKTSASTKTGVPARVVKARAEERASGTVSTPDWAKQPAETKATSSSELKKRELIDLVVEKSDVKKKYAKPVVEALLEVLGDAIASGRELNLQPMGKLKYNRSKETSSARIVVAKLRQSKTSKLPAAASRGSAVGSKE